MLTRARLLRSRIEKLGAAGRVIETHVLDRLRWLPTEDLPPDQGQLVDEIIELLDDPKLSPEQVSQLEHAIFRARYPL